MIVSAINSVPLHRILTTPPHRPATARRGKAGGSVLPLIIM
jgi:hypothetical protein